MRGYGKLTDIPAWEARLMRRYSDIDDELAVSDARENDALDAEADAKILGDLDEWDRLTVAAHERFGD